MTSATSEDNATAPRRQSRSCVRDWLWRGAYAGLREAGGIGRTHASSVSAKCMAMGGSTSPFEAWEAATRSVSRLNPHVGRLARDVAWYSMDGGKLACTRPHSPGQVMRFFE